MSGVPDLISVPALARAPLPGCQAVDCISTQRYPSLLGVPTPGSGWCGVEPELLTY